MRRFLLLIACCWTVTLCGELHQCYNIRDLLDHVDDETLVLFDLDNTLIETGQCLGSDQWFNHTLSKRIKAGQTVDEALAEVLPLWWRVIKVSQFHAVESSTAEVVLELQQRAAAAIGLTSRGAELKELTCDHLNGAGMDLTRNPVGTGFSDDHDYAHGVIFCSGKSKGAAIQAFLSQYSDQSFKRVIFIDDTMRHVRVVESAIEAMGMDFVGLRYGVADEKVNAFDHDVASVQLHIFELLVTDEMAQAIIDRRYEDAIDYLVNHLEGTGVL